MVVEIRRWQFTVADYARMGKAGIFTEDDRVELIDGEVRAMSPIGPRHAAIVKRLNALLSRQVANRAIISVQDPIQLTDYPYNVIWFTLLHVLMFEAVDSYPFWPACDIFWPL